MVIDQISNASVYLPLGPRIARALDYLRHTDLAGVAPGRYDLDGSDVYALVSEYVSKRPEEGRWEAHRRYIDLQSVDQRNGADRLRAIGPPRR